MVPVVALALAASLRGGTSEPLAQISAIELPHVEGRIDHLAFDAADRPLFSSTIKYAGERYRLRTSFSRLPQAFGTRR